MTMSEQMNPILSRRTVSPNMAERGMRPAAELAQTKPCGTRIRYYGGCRCQACKGAAADYERQRRYARERGETNYLVSAERCRAHLVWLSSRGVGRKTAADAAKVPASIVSLIVDGARRNVRQATERRILAVTEAAAADRAYIDGTDTWRMLDELLACGYPKSRLASEIIGHKVHSLQLTRERVTARNAEQVRRMYARLRYATLSETQQALAFLAELREECFRPDRVLREAANLAHARNLPEPSFALATKGDRKGCMRLFEIGLVRDVHAMLMGECE